MSIIRILPEDVSNRIAAGEVIERPASVVKELVENALDAGTTRLTIQVDRGGRSLVRVIDNGCGMDAEDALMCLEAHATSKIRERTDIGDIRTLGFRGEALPSIASVTRFQLRTRPQDADEGTEVNVTGGVIQNVGPTGCAPGTTVQVRNLFFNLPARKKFLRSIATEESHIQEIVQLLAFAHPEVSFDLFFDDRSILSVQGGSDMRTRAAMLLGRETVAAMVPVDHTDDHIHVTGFAARPGLTRSTRRDQRTFVNGRPVTADGIHFAIRDAYHSMVMKGRYPPVLLFITLPPDRVDINVHPAKREVRFREHRQVGEVVSAGIRQALRGLSQPEIIPSPSPAQPQMMPAAA
ncbi:MAG: DNA mismatch repair endonuclease MutL, partial [Lentisphaeria bacterium]|nr:DNA mismatch repair endonuclease MutL [Lentisphaeria bacterium]